MTSLSRQIEEKGEGGILRVQPVVLVECERCSNVAEPRDVHVFAEFLRFKPLCVCVAS